MASCVQCGKPIGLIEYTLGDSNQLGLCKNCRKTQKLCDNCAFMLTISMEDSAIIRCIKYGYNLTNKKDRKNKTNRTKKDKKRKRKGKRSPPFSNASAALTKRWS